MRSVPETEKGENKNVLESLNSKVEDDADGIEPPKSAKADICETFKLLLDSRMALLYPTMTITALNLMKFSMFIKIMVATMESSESENEAESKEKDQ